MNTDVSKLRLVGRALCAFFINIGWISVRQRKRDCGRKKIIRPIAQVDPKQPASQKFRTGPVTSGAVTRHVPHNIATDNEKYIDPHIAKLGPIQKGLTFQPQFKKQLS